MTARAHRATRVVIVGASVAGVAVARGLRSERYDGEVVLIGEEEEWPYDKPPLSKQLLTGEWAPDRVVLLTAEETAKLAIDVRLGLAATHLDIASREVVLRDGSRIGYGACVIATGASARPSPWPQRPGVQVLRTLQDALKLRGRLLEGGAVAVVGGGFIGAEVASSARSLGLPVTIIDPLPLPMERIVGSGPARMFAEMAARNGIDLRLGHGVKAITGKDGELTLTLTDGSTVAAATAVVGIGARPNDAWLGASGLVVDDGVLCDETCRAVGTDDVFAAGDVARWRHPVLQTPLRVEHWTNAVDQAACVAHNITHPGGQRVYAPIPYVWTDQHGCKFQIVGLPAAAARRHTVGDLGADRPRAAVIYMDRDGHLRGALSVNWPRALSDCRRAMADGGEAQPIIHALGERLALAVPR